MKSLKAIFLLHRSRLARGVVIASHVGVSALLIAVADPGWIAFAASKQEQSEDNSTTVVRATTEAFSQAIEAAQEAQDDNPAHIRELVNQIVMPHVDLNQVSYGVLGIHWQQATPAQQESFAAGFRKLLVCAYGSALSENRALDITYLPVTMSEDGAEAAVPTRVMRGEAAPLGITYRLQQVEGEWKLYDMLVEGVSFVNNYRSMFLHQIDQIGIDGLIQKLMVY